MAASTSLFNDPVHEIQELIYIIKKDIAALNKKIEEIKLIGNKSNKHSELHTDQVLHNLTVKLQKLTKNFQNILTIRSEVFHFLFFGIYLNLIFGN